MNKPEQPGVEKKPARSLKRCATCKQQRPIEEFGMRPTPREGQRYSYCRECVKVRSAGRADYRKDWELRRRYGISLAQFRAMEEQQKNKCAICQDDSDSLHVDHCHSTGEVRGLLCVKCNRGIGLLQDAPDVCRAASKYLEKS